MNDMQSISIEFSSLEPQLIHVSNLLADEACQIQSKEGELSECFRGQFNEYSEVSFVPGYSSCYGA